MTCVRALEQGAYAVYELAAFHPELFPPLPDSPTPSEVGEWLVRLAGAVRNTLPAEATAARRLIQDEQGTTYSGED